MVRGRRIFVRSRCSAHWVDYVVDAGAVVRASTRVVTGCSLVSAILCRLIHCPVSSLIS